MLQDKNKGVTLNFLTFPINRSGKFGFYINGQKTPVPPQIENQLQSIEVSRKELLARLQEPPKIPRIETHPPFQKEFKDYPND